MLTDLKFAYLAPDELRPDPRNPRTHSKKQVEQIAASMTELGFAGAIVINADRIIIAGHARYRAAKLLGLEQVPTITVSGLTPDQEKLLRIADNKLALNGGWDLDLLKIQIDEIRTVGLDVELTGYSVGEIDLLLSGPQTIRTMMRYQPFQRRLSAGPGRSGCAVITASGAATYWIAFPLRH